MNQISYEHANLILTDRTFEVPLDYDNPDKQKVTIFCREISRKEYHNKSTPYLIFFQGGPGYESPRPLTDSGWIKKASQDYKVLLLDQRGTGLSNPITEQSFSYITGESLARYLTFFRADNIVKDAEFIRKQIIGNEKWSILGQSFGGFCATNYLSYYPDSLEKVFIAGGLPPLNAHPDDIYRSTYKRVIQKNKQFYETFPCAKGNVRKIAKFLKTNEIFLPNGDPLTLKRFQQLGLNLGFSDGMATLNFLFERAFVNNELSYFFLKGILSLQSFDTNPIFTVLHEACYAQGFSTNWSAQRILKEFPEFSENYEDTLYFTGEMLYPWMMNIYSSLKLFKDAAQILSKKNDWNILYDEKILRANEVPIAAAVYTNDMYVDRNFSMELASIIPKVKIWETDKLEHNGLRSDGEKVLNNLFKLLK